MTSKVEFSSTALAPGSKPTTMAPTEINQGFDFELKSLKGDSRGLVITVSEASPLPAARITPPPSKSRNGGSPRASSPLRESTTPEPPSRAGSPVPDSPVRSHTSSPTLVRNGSIASTGTHSPVMRSMFPRFDPSVPVAQQNYYPTMDRVPPPPPVARQEAHYSPSLYSQPGSPPVLARENWGRSTPMLTSTPQSPLQHLSEEVPVNLSGPEELLSLWDLANGQTHNAADTYTLGLHW